MDRRTYLQLAGGAAGMASVAGCLGELTGGDEFPDGSITCIVPFDEGGGSDVIVRQMADPLSENLDATIEVTNVPGAGAMRGIGQLLGEDADGYTIGKFNPLTTSIQAMIEQPDFEMTDLEGVATIGYNAIVVIGDSDEEIDGMDDLIGRYEDGEFETIGGLGVNYLVHATFFRELYGMPWDRYIQYSGAGPINEAIASGEVPAAITSDAGAASAVESDDADVIAVLTTQGSGVFPDEETVVDQGYEEIDFVGQVTRSMWAPDGTSDDRIDVLTEGIQETIESDEMQSWADESGNPLVYDGPDHANETLESIWEDIPDLVDVDDLRDEAGE
jgi:tripartite-type tricarboxylate transporter receptor subunit TctC